MKKAYLLFFALMAVPVLLLSQEVLLLDAEGNDITNGNIEVSGSHEAAVLKAEIFMHNDTDGDLQIWVRRHEDDLVNNTYNSFCWDGYCFSPAVSESPDPIVLGAGQTSGPEDFYAEYFPEGNSGTSIITYEFYHRQNAFEPITVTVHFVAEESTSVIGPNTANWSFGLPSPNPASGFTWISYSLPRDVVSARLVLRSMTGAVVMEIPLVAAQDQVMVDTSQLRNGIYLYSLEVDARLISTKKLVVNQ